MSVWQKARIIAKDSKFLGHEIWTTGAPQSSRVYSGLLILLTNVTRSGSPWPNHQSTVEWQRAELLPEFAEHVSLVPLAQWKEENPCDSKHLH